MPKTAFNCPCPEKDCPHHSDCSACVKYHKEKNEEPYCCK
jgi:hypothetical protein